MFEIVAHRGAPENEPENTLPAFEHALALGADVIELDVRLAADGMPVVFHYYYLGVEASLPGPVFQYTWDEIRRATITKRGSTEPAEARSSSAARIPSLDETLHALAGRVGLEIDVKGPEPECVDAIVSAIHNHPRALENLEISSYETTLIERFRQRLPGVPVDMLIPLSEPWMKADVLAYSAVQRCRLAGARAVHLHASQLSEAAISAIRLGGGEVHAWGINDGPALQAAADLHITRICTDHLRQATQYREAMKR